MFVFDSKIIFLFKKHVLKNADNNIKKNYYQKAGCLNKIAHGTALIDGTITKGLFFLRIKATVSFFLFVV